jgi:hypothetical protein
VRTHHLARRPWPSAAPVHASPVTALGHK